MGGGHFPPLPSIFLEIFPQKGKVVLSSAVCDIKQVDGCCANLVFLVCFYSKLTSGRASHPIVFCAHFLLEISAELRTQQAGLGLGHHDRAVHDVEAPAQASSQHSCMWPAVARCATDVKHKEGGQQAHDEQLQQRSGRREGRTQHDRAHEPAPTAATGGGIASARRNYYLSFGLYLVYDSVCLFGRGRDGREPAAPPRGRGIGNIP